MWHWILEIAALALGAAALAVALRAHHRAGDAIRMMDEAEERAIETSQQVADHRWQTLDS